MAEAKTNGKKHITDLKILKEEITCKLCSQQYQNPKTLPCLHSVCAKCLQNISTTDETGTRIECPDCKKEVQVQSSEFNDLPDAFFINRQIELYGFLMKVNGRVEIKCEKCSNKSVRATTFCPDCGKFICELCVTIHRSWSEFTNHKFLSIAALKNSYRKYIPEPTVSETCVLHSKECTIYCESCEEQICYECIVKGHRGHQYNLAAESLAKHKATMKKRLDNAHDIPNDLEEAIGKINAICEGFSAEGQTVVRDINTQFDELEKIIATRRKALLQEITSMVESKLKLLTEQKACLEEVKAMVTSCIEFVTQTVSSDHTSEFFILEHKMAERISEVKKEFSSLDLMPVEEPEAHFIFEEGLVERLKAAGSVSDGSILHSGPNGSQDFTVNKVITFHIALSSAYYKTKSNPISMEEIKAEIQSVRDGSVCPATIAVSSSGFAKVRCSFSERGRYAIKVTVGDRHISGSPHTFMVKPPSTQFQVPVKSIDRLNSPMGIAMNNKNQIIVCEENRHIVSVYGRKLKKVLSFGSFGSKDAQFNHPIGVAVDESGCIYVGDSKNNRLQKFDQDGNLLAMFTGEKSACGNLHSPTGVKINQVGNLFVVDRGNSRVVVLNRSLEFQRTFGSPGFDLGQLQDPWDIAFDRNGFSYVTDTKQHCIQIFNHLGEFRGKIGSHGTQKSRLNRPSGIAIDQFERIYVSEFGNHRVSIFHTSSDFIDCFSTGLSMVTPCALAIDDDGFVYVSSAENVHVF